MKFDDDEFEKYGEDDWVVYLWISALILTVTVAFIVLGN